MTLKNRCSYLSIIVYCIIYVYYLYFAFCSLFGIANRGNSMIIVHFSMFVFSFVLYFGSMIKRKNIELSDLILFGFVCFFYLSYLMGEATYGKNNVSLDTLKDFTAKSIPSLMIGIYLAKCNKLDIMDKGVKFIVAFLTVFSLKILFSSLVKNISPQLWDEHFLMNYQNASYTAAFCSGLCLYKLFYPSTKLKKILYGLAFVINSMLAIYSGGRGGVVVILIDLIVLTLIFMLSNKDFKRNIKYVIFIFGLLLIFFIAINGNIILQSGITRAFEFIGKNGINWDGTSGRKEIYQKSIAFILERPLLGYGIGGSPRVGIDRAHNILLDILLDGGIVYFIIWIFTIIFCVIYSVKRIKYNKNYALLLIIFTGDFIMLNFSLVYTRSTGIWFFLIFCITDSIRNKELKYENINVNQCLSSSR